MPSTTAAGTGRAELASSVLYGFISSLMVLPVSISFCSIIFRDEAFAVYLPQLVKLVLFSSAIHQICFASFSSLPFAIGQVQDAGLIFLSAMAANIAMYCEEPDNILPTTLFTLGICTAVLGMLLLVVSKLHLASLVQYLPMPVIGGYLAFIGFYCGEAGLTMMAGVSQIWDIFTVQSFVLLLPGLVVGVAMYLLLRTFRSPFVLPATLGFVLVAFYLILFVTNTSLEEARHLGWVAPLPPMASNPFEAWTYYDISRVEWALLPKQVFRLLGMFFVVAFSSSLDVAAIEMELGIPLDYNRELATVGISNMVSGIFGGYTGSYIFSQTIFTMRRGVNSRICGYIVAGCELLVVVLPISVTSYIPKAFFGSLLVLIATDLMFEWLFAAREKMMHSEYAVCLLTFCCIQYFGIEIGMMVGVLAAMTSFVVTYSKLQSVSAFTVKSSTVIRTFEDRAKLIATRGKIVTISFGGYIFFGSAVQVLEEIKSKLVLSTTVVGEASSSALSTPVLNPAVATGSKKASAATMMSPPAARKPSKVVSSRYTDLNPESELPKSFNLSMTTPKHTRRTPSKCKEDRPDYMHGSYQQRSIDKIEEESSSMKSEAPSAKYKFYGSSPPSQVTPEKLRNQFTLWSNHVQTSSDNHKTPEEVDEKTNLLEANDVEKGSWDIGDGVHYEDGNNSHIKEIAMFPLNLEPSNRSNEDMGMKKSDSLLHFVLESQAERRRKRTMSDGFAERAAAEAVEASLLDEKPSIARSSPSRGSNKSTGDGGNILSKESVGRLGKEQSLFPRPKLFEHTEDDASNVSSEVVTEYLVLDFSGVLGVDATAARSCFLTLVHLMKNAHVTVVFANLEDHVEELLRAHHVIDTNTVLIPHLDDALEWCEDQVLGNLSVDHSKYADAAKQRQTLGFSDAKKAQSLQISPGEQDSPTKKQLSPEKTLRTILEDYLELERGSNNTKISSLLEAPLLQLYFKKEKFSRLQIIFDIDDIAEKIYFIERGMVEIVSLPPIDNSADNALKELTRNPSFKRTLQKVNSNVGLNFGANSGVVRVNKVSSGGVFGESDFFLGRNHSVRAYAVSDCACWTLDKERFAAMEISHPQLCMLIQFTLLKSLSIASTCSMYALHPTTAMAEV